MLVPSKIISVSLLDDSAVFRHYLTKVLRAAEDIRLLAVYGDPVKAVGQITREPPQVILVDMEMPNMRGNEFLRQVLPRCPRSKAVVISSRSENVFDAMRAGAIDFVEKPGESVSNDAFARELVQKIRIAALANNTAVRTKAPLTTAGFSPLKSIAASGSGSRTLIAIGASTGGTEAILEVVKRFPGDTPGVVVVQHMPPVFTKMYADRLDRVCAMRVQEACDGDRVEQGRILIAPGGTRQMYVKRDPKGYYVQLVEGEKVGGHCPSVNVLFESLAACAGAGAIGVLLTGMGADGASGLGAMRRAGAYTFGQDEATSIVYGMPRVAFENGAVSRQLPLDEIGPAVLQRLSLR